MTLSERAPRLMAHFQNHRVPPDEACYTCHTNYAMFGGIRAKLGGLKHIYVYYLGTPPAPENIKLYEPYNNRECLHCHEGARSFEAGAVHNADPDLLPAVKANKISCISSGCHEVVHNVQDSEAERECTGAAFAGCRSLSDSGTVGGSAVSGLEGAPGVSSLSGAGRDSALRRNCRLPLFLGFCSAPARLSG